MSKDREYACVLGEERNAGEAERKTGLHPKLLGYEEANNALSPLQTWGLPMANTQAKGQ